MSEKSSKEVAAESGPQRTDRGAQGRPNKQQGAHNPGKHEKGKPEGAHRKNA